MDTKETPVFKCVPLDNRWTIPGTKLDLKAIYRRARRSTGEYDEVIHETGADGLPLWDLTGPLPLRRHADWLAKGYEYVTLADMKSLQEAAPYLQEQGLQPREFIQHPQFGPWNPKLYMAAAEGFDRAKYDKVLAAVRQHGIAAYEEISGQKVPEAVKRALAAEQKAAPAPRTANTGDGSAEAAASTSAPAKAHRTKGAPKKKAPAVLAGATVP